MAGLYDLLYVGNSGLQAYQRQINVRSQNIANVNTRGYSRRYLEQSSTSLANGYGTGVRTGDVIRSFNSLGTATLLREGSSAEYHAELSRILSELEQVVGTDSSGLGRLMQNFETAWQNLAASPDDLTARTAVLQSAQSLVTGINNAASGVDNFVSGISTDTVPYSGAIPDAIADINTKTERLQELNEAITRAENAGRTAPDLSDERDMLVSELAEMANISVSPDYRITLGGQELVSADGLNRQTLDQTGATTFAVGGVDVTAEVTGGYLAALVTSRNVGVGMRAELDTFASSLATQVNSIFNSSYNLNGETPDSLGYTFFTGTTADSLAIDTALYDPSNPLASHPELLAAAATRASAGPPPIPNRGDNGAAQAIFNQLQAADAALDNQSTTDFLISLESDLGSIIKEEAQLASDGEKMVELLNQKMDSVAGVNLDEEVMHLMSAQRAYEASARVISTASNMLDILLNQVR